jgi:branched-subunit amino acid transport protein
MNPRANPILAGIVFGALWAAGVLWRAPEIDLRTVVIAIIAGAIAGLLAYWVLANFGGRLRG